MYGRGKGRDGGSSPAARLLCAMALAALVGCGGGGGGGTAGTVPGTNGTDSGDGSGTGDGGGTAAAAIDGFDFLLREGDFWEFGWTGQVSSYAQGGGGSSSTEGSVFRITLGAPRTIDGVTAYAVETTGNPRWGSTWDFTPRWKYLAVADDRIYGSTDGTTLEVVFDARTGRWAGGGFFSEWPTDTLIVAGPGTIDNDFVTDTEAVAVGRSSSQAECETIAGVTVCGDSAFDHEDKEFFKPGVGLLGYRYVNASSYSGGGFSSGSSKTFDAGLIASSLRGDAVDYVLEREPNNAPADAMAVTLPVKVRGDDLTEFDEGYGGWTSVVLRTTPEAGGANANWSEATAQTLTLPVLLQGTVQVGDSASVVQVVPPSYSPYYRPAYWTAVEDWFTWDNDPQNLSFRLEWDAASGADLDLIVMAFDTPSYLDAFGLKDNVATGEFFEGISILPWDQTSSDYRVLVDAVSTPNGPVDYTLRIDAPDGAGPAIEALVADWFRITLATAQVVTAAVQGADTVLLTDADGATVLALGEGEGSAALNSGVLDAGEYRVGVAGVGESYELEVTAQ